MPLDQQASQYGTFIECVRLQFLQRGGQVLAHATEGLAWAGEASGFDLVVLETSTGSANIYAFTRVTTIDSSELQRRLDYVAGRMRPEALNSPGGVNLIVVAVSETALDPQQKRRYLRMVPNAYMPGLRPTCWTVSLMDEQVSTRGLWKRPEAADAIAHCMSADSILHGSAPVQSSIRRTDSITQWIPSSTPYATYSLIAINVIIFLVMASQGALNPQGPQFDSTERAFGALAYSLVADGQWWRIFTSMFLHAGIQHIAFNMISLFAVGALAERLYGTPRFLLLYLGAGIIGGIASFGYHVATAQLNDYGVGASGAIFGVAGALVTARFQRNSQVSAGIRNRISQSMFTMILISLPLSGFLAPNVDNSAHVGGLLGGVALSLLFALPRRAKALA